MYGGRMGDVWGMYRGRTGDIFLLYITITIIIKKQNCSKTVFKFIPVRLMRKITSVTNVLIFT